MYYKNAAAVCMVYDVTKEDSFDSLQRWMREVDEHRPDNALVVVVGNKCDLAGEEKVQLK